MRTRDKNETRVAPIHATRGKLWLLTITDMSRNKVNNVLSAFDDAIADIIDIPTDDDDEDIGELTSLHGKRPLQAITGNGSHSENPAKRRNTNTNHQFSPSTRPGQLPEPAFDMARLFPNAFQEQPVSVSANNVQVLTENQRIGPPLPDALEHLGLSHPSDLIQGLEIKLMKHQIIGVSWMLKQEFDRQKKGGILADEMGLGKTIQILALMVLNPRGSTYEKESVGDTTDKNNKIQKSGFSKTTLVVAPASLLRQWKEEIEMKSQEGLFRVHIHHGKEKLKSVKEIRAFDIVIVSYQTLMAEFPSQLDKLDQSGWLPEHGGPLARMKWHRIVLDEAQVIRNRLTQSAQCIFRLQTNYRWCLSGTPIFNGVSDIFSYLKICQPGTYSWDVFNRNICQVETHDPARATSLANEWLEPLMLRRTKLSRLDGRLILEELPPKHIEIVELEFSEGERKIYDEQAARTERTIGELVSKGLEEQYHMFILVLILRLRQLCGHPSLMLALKDPTKDPNYMSKLEKEKTLNRARRELGRPWVDRMKAAFRERAMKRDSMVKEDTLESCIRCREVMEGNAMLVACGHMVCADCLDDLAKSEMRTNGDMEELEADEGSVLRPCPTCKMFIDPNKAYKAAAFQVSEEELVFGGAGYRENLAAATTKKKRKEKDADMDSDDELPSADALMADFKAVSDDEEKKDESEPAAAFNANPNAILFSQAPVLTPAEPEGLSAMANLERWKNPKTPSTKLVAMINMLKEWEADPATSMDKVIIYSQWTTMLDIVEEMFEQHNIISLRYDGKMSRDERDEAIARFKRTGGPKIILISIKSGSVGLNLTCANRIINLDLSWSLQAEQQAYDRAHRIGQTKPTYVKRYIVKNTIEERLLQLQKDKQEMAAATLGEGDAPAQRMNVSLTARDLTGLVMKDGNNSGGRRTRH